MKPDPGNNFYELSSGRKIYANGLILGINDEAEAYEGYDGNLELVDKNFIEIFGPPEAGGETPFTKEERREIADYATSKWNEWASNI